MVVPVVFGLAVGAFFLMYPGFLGQELFPSVDSGQFQMYVRMPSGTRIEETENTIQQIETDIIAALGQADPGYGLGKEYELHPDSQLQLLISNIGVLMDWPAAYTPNSGPMDAFMLVQLKNKRGRQSVFNYVEAFRAELTAKYPDVEFAFDTGGMLTAALNMGEPSPIHFQVRADLPAGQAAARPDQYGSSTGLRERPMCESPSESTILFWKSRWIENCRRARASRPRMS